VDVVEGEHVELGEAHKSVRSGVKLQPPRSRWTRSKGEEGGKGMWMRSASMAALGSNKHLDGELLDMLVDEGELVVGAFQVVQADAGSEAANGRVTPTQEAGVECGG
jgi:hypothetical protein